MVNSFLIGGLLEEQLKIETTRTLFVQMLKDAPRTLALAWKKTFAQWTGFIARSINLYVISATRTVYFQDSCFLPRLSSNLSYRIQRNKCRTEEKEVFVYTELMLTVTLHHRHPVMPQSQEKHGSAREQSNDIQVT